jgi:hypothetical protein
VPSQLVLTGEAFFTTLLEREREREGGERGREGGREKKNH